MPRAVLLSIHRCIDDGVEHRVSHGLHDRVQRGLELGGQRRRGHGRLRRRGGNLRNAREQQLCTQKQAQRGEQSLDPWLTLAQSVQSSEACVRMRSARTFDGSLIGAATNFEEALIALRDECKAKQHNRNERQRPDDHKRGDRSSGVLIVR